MNEGGPQAGDTSVEAKKKTSADLYFKLLEADQYAPAQSVDTSLLGQEELESIRQRVFSKKAKDIGLRYYQATDAKKKIEELKKHLGISDELAREKLKQAYLDTEEDPIQPNQRGYPRMLKDGRLGDDYFGRFKNLLTEYEITLTEDEIIEAKERGIVKEFGRWSINIIAESGRVTEIAKAFQVSEETFKSSKFQQLFLEAFFSEIEKADLRDVGYGWNRDSYTVKSKFFPLELLRSPENQKKLDDIFVRKFVALAEQDGTIGPDVKVNDYQTIRPHANVLSALEAAKDFGVSPEVANSEAVGKIIHSYIGDSVSSEEVRVLDKEVIEYFAIKLEDHQKKAAEVTPQNLSEGKLGINKLVALRNEGLLTDEFLRSKEFIAAYKQYVESLLNGDDEHAEHALYTLKQVLGTSLPLPKETLQEAHFTEIKKAYLLRMVERSYRAEGIKEFIELFDFSHCQDFFSSEEIKKILESQAEDIVAKIGQTDGTWGNGFIYRLSSYLEWVQKGRDYNSYYKDQQTSPWESLTKLTNVAGLLGQKDIIQQAFLNGLSTQMETETHISYQVLESVNRSIENIQAVFGFDPEKIRPILVGFFVKNLGLRFRSGHHDWKDLPCALEDLKKYQSTFKFDDVQMKKIANRAFQIQVMVRGKNPNNDRDNMEPRFLYANYEGHIYSNLEEAKKIAKVFRLDKEFVAATVQELYQEYISRGRDWDKRAEEVIKAFPQVKFGDLNIEQFLLEKVTKLIEEGNVKGINDLKDTVEFGMQADTFTPEILEKVKGLFLKELFTGDVEQARTLSKIFRLKIEVQEIIDSNETAKEFFEKLKIKLPALATRFSRSVDSFITVLPFIKNPKLLDVLEEYPEMVTVVEGNPQYGMRLIARFPTFDKLSRTNIQELMQARWSIAEEKHIDPNSRDFRIAMQEHLASYRSNPLITEAMRREGVNVEEWLNYEEEVYVELGESERPASEQIREAVQRISQSLEQFLLHHKDTVKEFEKELAEYKIPAQDKAQLEEDLAKMRERLTQAANEKEATGIQKGIANIESQLANPKMVSVWSRFNGEMQRISVLRKDIFDSFEKLNEKEIALTDIQSSEIGAREKRKEIQKVKKEIQALKVGLIEKASKIGEQVDTMEAKLVGFLEGPLGKERAESLAQEISEKISEPLDHTRTDITTIEHSLGENTNLQGTSLRIALWDRNPDVDLYLGNYTDCCIRIDSEHLGSECAIADYLTDVGMHVVTIVDEKKKIPVAAAWCWIGKDNNDNIALVIDNVEANTDYSTKYREVLEPKLRDYFLAYAKAIGVKRIVQGPTYNDLMAAEVMKSKYYKVGGYNRPSGYYLEGEDTGAGGDDDEGGWEPEDEGAADDFEDEDEPEDDNN